MRTYTDFLILKNHMSAFLDMVRAVPGVPLDDHADHQGTIKAAAEAWKKIKPDSPLNEFLE